MFIHIRQIICLGTVAFPDSSVASNGVKHGRVSSPILFCVYINGLVMCLKDAKLECNVSTEYVGVLAYADDLTLLAAAAGCH
jgi:Na+/serine symporter